jgi:hypothetical protein
MNGPDSGRRQKERRRRDERRGGEREMRFYLYRCGVQSKGVESKKASQRWQSVQVRE